MRRTARIAALPALAATLALAACGGSSSLPSTPTIAPAKTFEIVDFKPARLVPNRSENLSFSIRQPSGQPLTDYKRGAGPHTGVHLIIVRDDLSTIIHRHPPMRSGGRFDQPVTFPGPGRYRVVVDAYPKLINGLRNFQLFKLIQVGKGDPQARLPAPASSLTVDGYRFTLKGAAGLRAITPKILHVTVTDRKGKPAAFTPYYGALAHAIFFRAKGLDYFHTHVCGPDTPGCTSQLGAIKVRGTSTEPGKLNVGVLVPLPGVWRLFLQAQTGGRVLTAPFTLKVK